MMHGQQNVKFYTFLWQYLHFILSGCFGNVIFTPVVYITRGYY